MAFDFYRQDNNEYLFGLEDNQFENLNEIFNEFKYRTGYVVDQYKDFKMTLENQEAIIKIIDNYINKTDLNKDKAKTLTIIELRTALEYCSDKKIELKLKGD